jgi:hypothetical protein
MVLPFDRRHRDHRHRRCDRDIPEIAPIASSLAARLIPALAFQLTLSAERAQDRGEFGPFGNFSRSRRGRRWLSLPSQRIVYALWSQDAILSRADALAALAGPRLAQPQSLRLANVPLSWRPFRAENGAVAVR